jgi:hypothetical protein
VIRSRCCWLGSSEKDQFAMACPAGFWKHEGDCLSSPGGMAAVGGKWQREVYWYDALPRAGTASFKLIGWWFGTVAKRLSYNNVD